MTFTEFAAQEKRGWADAQIVAAYIERFVPITDVIARQIVERARPAGKTTLDLCCGQGTLTAMLAGAGADVTGVDFSEEMLKHVDKRGPGAVFKHGDAGKIPFEDDSFDLVVCNFGLMHLPDQGGALDEVRRVLRPLGSVFAGGWAPPDASPGFNTVYRAVRAHADFSDVPVGPDLFAFGQREAAEEAMKKAGLRIVGHDILLTAWTLDDPEELFEIFRTATVDMSALIEAQTPDVVEAMREDVTRAVRSRFRTASGYRVPVGAVIVEAEPA